MQAQEQIVRKPFSRTWVVITLIVLALIGLLIYDRFIPLSKDRFVVEEDRMICTMNIYGRQKHCLAEGHNPRWSPDGKEIVFSRVDALDSRRTHLAVMNSDGQNIRLLIRGKFIEEMPIWSRDGEKIAYSSGDIYVLDLRKGTEKKISNGQWNFVEMDWSPDSSQIVFSGSTTDSIIDSQIYLLNLINGNVIQLTAPPGEYRHPRWSPDGRQIAFSSNRDVVGPNGADIYVMDSDGSNMTQLTHDPAIDYTPAWSPDGIQIAFLSNRDRRQSRPISGSVQLDLFQIYVMKADGNDIRQVTYDLFGSYDDIDWAPQ